MLGIEDFLIFGIGFAGAFIGSIAAGASLVTVPALLLLGVPPHYALGSDTLGGIGFRLGNFFKFLQHGNMGVPWWDVFVFAAISVPAAIIGTTLVVSIDAETLSTIIGVILILLLPLIFLKKDLGVKEDRATGLRRWVSHGLLFLSQAWAGFFAPGSGFFGTYICMRGYGYTILQGKAVSRIAHILADVASVAIFAAAAYIDYRIAAFLFVGMLLGGYVGTSVAITKGNAWIKPLLGVVIVVTAIKMLFF